MNQLYSIIHCPKYKLQNLLVVGVKGSPDVFIIIFVNILLKRPPPPFLECQTVKNSSNAMWGYMRKWQQWFPSVAKSGNTNVNKMTSVPFSFLSSVFRLFRQSSLFVANPLRHEWNNSRWKLFHLATVFCFVSPWNRFHFCRELNCHELLISLVTDVGTRWPRLLVANGTISWLWE